MAERKHSENHCYEDVETQPSTSRSNDCSSDFNKVPKVHGSWRSDAKSKEESILNVNSVNWVQHANYNLGFQFWPNTQPHNYYSAFYGHPSQQQYLYPNHFHSVSQEHQRQLHSSSVNVGERSIEDLRFWEKLNSAKLGFTFSVMSYNVLAQTLVDQHLYLYRNHNHNNLKWNVRWKNLIREIQTLQPNILCLQEVQKSHLKSHFGIFEQLGYKSLYKQRTGIRTDGCAIYYKHASLNLVEYTTVEYKQPPSKLLDRDNVAIIARFAPKNYPTKEFVVATTHLLYNPKRQDVRLAQTQLLLAEIDRIAYNSKDGYLPVIVTGDLNSTPDSAVYKFITKGKLRYEDLSLKSLMAQEKGPTTGRNFLPKYLRITDHCQHADLLSARARNVCITRSEELRLIELAHSERKCEPMNKLDVKKSDNQLFSSGTLRHNLYLKSVYKHENMEATTYQDEWVSVDYIFFSKPRPHEKGLILMERLRLPTSEELGDLKIPNAMLGSDHLSLMARFQLPV